MKICREATESDLEESDILVEVGDSIWTVTAEITHCPYCGECLQTPDISESEIEVEDDSETRKATKRLALLYCSIREVGLAVYGDVLLNGYTLIQLVGLPCG